KPDSHNDRVGSRPRLREFSWRDRRQAAPNRIREHSRAADRKAASDKAGRNRKGDTDIGWGMPFPPSRGEFKHPTPPRHRPTLIPSRAAAARISSARPGSAPKAVATMLRTAVTGAVTAGGIKLMVETLWLVVCGTRRAKWPASEAVGVCVESKRSCVRLHGKNV